MARRRKGSGMPMDEVFSSQEQRRLFFLRWLFGPDGRQQEEMPTPEGRALWRRLRPLPRSGPEGISGPGGGGLI